MDKAMKADMQAALDRLDETTEWSPEYHDTIQTLRANIAELEARCEAAEAALTRVKNEVTEWRKDAAEYLSRVGQHHPASLDVMADRMDAAIAHAAQVGGV